MLRQTADFIAGLRALNRPPPSRAYRWLSDPCGDCQRVPVSVLRPGSGLQAVRVACEAARQVHELRRSESRQVPVREVRAGSERAGRGLAREVRAGGSVSAVSGTGRGREDDVQAVSGRARGGCAETATAAGEGKSAAIKEVA